jgi:hypothetical protein
VAGFKTSYFLCKDLQLSGWKSQQDFESGQEPHIAINLKGELFRPDNPSLN